jgi:GNAT superfamily N-acetyltransferase
MPDFKLRRLTPDDAGEVLTVQRAAFVEEARLYGTVEIPPLTETLDEVRSELATTITVGAVLGARLVASARLTIEGSVGWVSRVAVAPDQQGRGIGSALLDAIENEAPPAVTRFQLGAAFKSRGNIAMYERRGYAESDRMTDAAGIELVLMCKPRGTRGTRRRRSGS